MSDDNIIYLIPPGNIRCFITDKLRKDKPEENVRQRWARSLVDEYGYSKTIWRLSSLSAWELRKKAPTLWFSKQEAKSKKTSSSLLKKNGKKKRNQIKARAKAS